MRQNTAIYFQKGLKPGPNGAGFWKFSRNLAEVQKHHGVCWIRLVSIAQPMFPGQANE